MRKSNAERQREFRHRRKERLATSLAETRPPEDAELLAELGEHRPGATAASKGDRPGKKPGSVVRGEITREWVLDQLRLFAIEPARGTTPAIQALKVLLAEIPKGNALSATEAPQVVKNVVRVQRPSDSALERMLRERAEQLGAEFPEAPSPPRGRIIGDEDDPTYVEAPSYVPEQDSVAETNEDAEEEEV